MPPFPGAGPPPGARIPIYIAAVNELMAETAGRVADGVLAHPMNSPRWLDDVLRPAIARGAAAAGRPASDVNVSVGAIVQISPDREQARLEAAYQVGFYATTRTYRPVLALHGLDDRIEPLRAALAAGDPATLAREALPMVDALAIAGTADEVRRRVAAYEGVADRVILGGSWVGPDPERIEANHRLILETFGRFSA
jgi:alkanesulfonate monooxygenase SsuD/methylene tetrahydromethanopterin reductase-like flavin-dependent oxidoreductase (luciferase family)